MVSATGGGSAGASAEAGAAVVVGVADSMVGAALVGVVICWLCGSGAALGAVDDALGDAEVGGAVVVGEGDDAGAAVSDVVEVVSGGAPGVLVGSTAGTSAADDGGTV